MQGKFLSKHRVSSRESLGEIRRSRSAQNSLREKATFDHAGHLLPLQDTYTTLGIPSKDDIRRPFTGTGRSHAFPEGLQNDAASMAHPSAAKSSVRQKPKSLSYLIQECDPGSESFPTTRELDFPDEWQKPTSVSSRPPSVTARYVPQRPNSVNSQYSVSSFQSERLGWNQRCLAALYGEEKGFRSPLTYLESKLNELQTKPSDSSHSSNDRPTVERTAAACELLNRLCPTMGRLGELLKQLADELFSSIYVDYVPQPIDQHDPIDFSSLSTFFATNRLQLQVVRSLQERLDSATKALADERRRCEELMAVEARFDGFTLRIRTLEREKDQIAAAAAAAAAAEAKASALERLAAAGSQARLLPEPGEGLLDSEAAAEGLPHKLGKIQRSGTNGINGSSGMIVEACDALARFAVDSHATMAAVLEATVTALEAAVSGPDRVDGGGSVASTSAASLASLDPLHGEGRRDLSLPSSEDRSLNGAMARTLLAWTCARLKSATTARSSADVKGGNGERVEDVQQSGLMPRNLEGDLADGHVLLHLLQASAPPSLRLDALAFQAAEDGTTTERLQVVSGRLKLMLSHSFSTWNSASGHSYEAILREIHGRVDILMREDRHLVVAVLLLIDPYQLPEYLASHDAMDSDCAIGASRAVLHELLRESRAVALEAKQKLDTSCNTLFQAQTNHKSKMDNVMIDNVRRLLLECHTQICGGFTKFQAAVSVWKSNLETSADTRCSVLYYVISSLLLRQKDSTNVGKRSSKAASSNLPSVHTNARKDDPDMLSEAQLSPGSAGMMNVSPDAKRRSARRATRMLSNLTPIRLHEMFASTSSEEELVLALEHCAEKLIEHYRSVAQAFYIYRHLFIGGGSNSIGIGQSTGLIAANSRMNGLSLAGWIQLLHDCGQMPPLGENEAEEIWQSASGPLGGPLDGKGFAEALVRLAWIQSCATCRPLNSRFDDIMHSIQGLIYAANVSRPVVQFSHGVAASQFHAACKAPEVVSVCTVHSDALRLAFLSFASPIQNKSSTQFVDSDAIPAPHSEQKPQESGFVLNARGLFSILEQSGVCDAKDMLLPMRLIEDIVVYILDVCAQGSDLDSMTVSVEDVHHLDGDADDEGMEYAEYCIALCACACYVYVDPFLSIAQKLDGVLRRFILRQCGKLYSERRREALGLSLDKMSHDALKSDQPSVNPASKARIRH